MRPSITVLVGATLLASCAGQPGVPSAGAPAPGGGLTVAEARAYDGDDPVAVTGSLVVEGDTARLCTAMLESYPPQCGQPSLVLDGFDLDSVDVHTEGNVAWADEPVSVVGTVNGDVLTVSDSSV